MNEETFASRLAEASEKIDAGHYLQALPLAQQLIAEYPNSAEATYLLGEALNLSGEKKTALEYFEKACQLSPKNFQYLYMCGRLYNHFSMYEYALSCLLRSVAIEPRACLSQYELGLSYEEMRLSEKALVHFRAALNLQPEHDLRQKIRINIADCLQVTNKTAEALPIFKRLVKEERNYRAHALACIVETEGSTQSSPNFAALKQLLENPESSDAEKRTAWLAIGKIFAKEKLTDKAFDAWRSAAELGKHPEEVRDNNDTFSETTGFYTSNLFGKLKHLGHPSPKPIFIAGMPRSGTTLTEQIVGSHSQAEGVGELGRWRALDDGLRNDYQGADYVAAMETNAKNGELRLRAEEILGMFSMISGGKEQRVIEKLPHNFIFAGYQALLFPNAKFLHLRRHPADSFLSTYQNNFSAFHSYGLDQKTYIEEWAFHERMMTYWKSIFGERILTVQYEKLATDPETEARRIIDFIGLPWEDQCLEFYKKNKTVRTFSTQQVRKPVYTSSVERWREYEKHLGPLFQTMEEMGLKYPPEP